MDGEKFFWAFLGFLTYLSRTVILIPWVFMAWWVIRKI